MRSKPPRLRSCDSDIPVLISKRSPRFTVSRWFTRQSSWRNRPWYICEKSPGEMISNWLDEVPGVAVAPVAAVGRPSRNCAHDCARSFSAAELLARVYAPLNWYRPPGKPSSTVFQRCRRQSYPAREVCSPQIFVSVGATENVSIGRLNPLPQSDRFEPSDEIVELSLAVPKLPIVKSGR